MPKTDPAVPLDDYAPVAERIALFYERFPTGRIITRLVSHDETEVVFKALVYRSREERTPAATGWAAERVGDGDINTVACLENTETSAVGRALANLGLTASRYRASREEIEKANRARARLSVTSAQARTTPSGTSSHLVAERVQTTYDATRQHLADRVTDVLELMASAERSGFPAERATEIRTVLVSSRGSADVLDRAERVLRRWFARRAERAIDQIGHPSDGASASPRDTPAGRTEENDDAEQRARVSDDASEPAGERC